MGLPRVDISIQNGGLGLVSNPDDRVVALVINGVPDQPLQIFSLRDAQSHASTADPAYGIEYYRQIEDFYKVAGEGAELWVQPVSAAISTAELFAGGVIANLLTVAGGRINVVGVSRFKAGTDNPTILDGMGADALDAMDEAQALGESFAAQYMPARFILDGRHFQGDPTTLRNLKSHTFNRVSICVGSNKVGAKNSAMGLLLGRIATIAPNINIGQFKDGSVPTSDGLLTNAQTVKNFGAKATALNDKGYIFLRQFIGQAGFYWNDDHTATADTDDYFSLSNGRVIDKAARIIYATFLAEVLSVVPVDRKGKILKTALKQYQAKAERAIGLTMGGAGEISQVACFIDPNQDILATAKLKIDVRITPTGTNRVISITLGLFNPNAA